MERHTDADLLALIRQDDHQAFSRLMGKYRAALVGYIRKRVGSGQEAEDHVQDIFLSLWQNRHQVGPDPSGSLAGYLYTAAKYTVIDCYAKRRSEIPYGDMLGEILDIAAHEQVDTDYLVAELQAIIGHEIAQMPNRLRQAYQLSREENLSIKEIARQLMLSEQTIKNNISAALYQLRSAIRRYKEGVLAAVILLRFAIQLFNDCLTLL
ncbi:sigma-70 family RNA polymerase sigma factor [Parapedobacter sp. ISTM3]|uniref:RNA polymerase sigma-70 factor, ECF subfamily n=1 Tax=Parapedobacter luteus TaxID=623280 RepID=A0A1T5CUU4_9SPHI|nr:MULTISPECIES: sigma-70 family RNA polymerase sigma factor [Parapedobacter]MBK1440703.1 sigma-70 family RNA polymerase sigma factor [Parapedobacter sp. ISTM3]SKB63275.1 RNA polymerase sigma-70 factor, ECF subfamily [Parapedobacter luteus]